MSKYPIAKAVKLHYKHLIDTSSNLNSQINAAFGPTGLGICVIEGIPSYEEFRLKLLPLSYKLAKLPPQKLKDYERPEVFHSKGWSCGVEQFKGKYDTSKGSFYNNPLFDNEVPLTESEKKELGDGLKLRVPNVWPRDTIPELEFAYKNLARLMVDVGAQLAYHIDRFVYSQNQNYEENKLFRFIKQGDQHCARLLHYYANTKITEDGWCGWHNDHSALTALTAPLYMSEQGEVIEDYDDAGLYAKNRFAEIQKVEFDKNCLAFQIGETAQIVSGGIVEATPHCVIKSRKTAEQNLNRNTLALFMAPKFNEILNLPSGVDGQKSLNKEGYQVPSLIERWQPEIKYLDYSYNSYKMYS